MDQRNLLLSRVLFERWIIFRLKIIIQKKQGGLEQKIFLLTKFTKIHRFLQSCFDQLGSFQQGLDVFQKISKVGFHDIRFEQFLKIFTMAKKSLQQVIKQYQQYGLHPSVIQIAYNNVKGDDTKIFDQVFRLQSESASHPVNPGNPQDEQAQLNKAIELSMNDAKQKKINLEPLNPEQRVRKPGVPVGLKNIGNTCYFNSLLQTYFQNAHFVREILKYQIPDKYAGLSKEQVQKRSQQNFEFKRKLASCKLVQNLKSLFAQMIASDRKYVDPTPVLTSIVDDYGNELPIGDQKDIGEFNLIFLSRIDEGLGELHNKEKMQIEGEENLFQDSPSKLKVIGGQDENLPDASHSLLKHSSIKLTQSSIVSQQFIGKISTSFHNQNLNFHKEQEELFSLLFVNVKNKQLYQALQEVVISHIDDYRNEKGQVVGVEKRTWIQQAPKTLFFQIDRVVFDKEKGTLQKINDVFDFPKEFYIDPFLNKNKEQALKIQKTVRSLREKKLQYIENLNQLQNYGKDKKSLLQTMQTATEFLYSQANKMQLEENPQNFDSEPLSFPSCQKRISPELISVLQIYVTEIEKKENQYKRSIENIEEQIERCYESIRTEPYILSSILIHEGSAQMGHYYSYVFDIETNTWKKYNDINISDESPEQVFKEAKGQNFTSAYYLVYVLKDVLSPLGSQSTVRNHSMSNDDNYMKDYYSSFLNPKMKEKIISENHQMYNEIEQYKMGSFATRVVDSYAKKFEICNQTFRKNKPQKKKNCPPLLINLPLYLKFNDQNQYKNALIDHCIQEYGPKEYNPAFDEMLTKKMSNFNEFKRPKTFKGDDKFIAAFMEDIYNAIASKHIFQAIKQSSYSKIFSLLKELQSQSQGSYFNWLSNLLSKTIIVHLMIEAESQISSQPEQSLKNLKLMVFLLFRFINLDEEKVLQNNCIIWLAEMALSFQNADSKEQCERIASIVGEKNYKGQFDELFINKQTENVMSDIRGSVEIADATWNLSRTEDVIINDMLTAREQVKEIIQAANELYRDMKKHNLPLTKEERNKIILKKKNV